MTEKEVIVEYAKRMRFEGTEKEIEEQSRKSINTYVGLLVDTAMAEGKCSFGKVGTFKSADVKAKPARLHVENALVPGTYYDIAAKPARTKLMFSLSKSGKLIGA